MRVGFIGLGEMGGAMARRIIDAGFTTVLWARRPEALTPFEGERVETADTPADLAARVDLVCVCVWTDDDVREVLGGEQGVLAGCRPGAVVAIHSTVAPATCRELADEAGGRDVTVLDVPVSGGRDVALAGNLAVAVGGDEEAAERCRPVFETYGDPVLYVGPVGAAQAVKLVNNALLAANLAVADDALTVGGALGIRPEAMQQLLRSGSGRSYALDVVIGARGSPEIRAAARPALEKDVHALAAAASAEDAEAALLLRAAEEAVTRLGDPPPGWAPG
jgi:3-hydroxyisobutyrate dehydrogenase-like beta-hydroxyacid dehydrogenase